MKVIVTAQRGLNVRSCSSIACKRVGVLPHGTIVDVLERHGVWGRIAAPVTGWLHMGYTRPVHDDEASWLPVDALDMSHYQRRLSNLFWNGAVRPWMVILKATQGTFILDSRFGERWARLRWAGWRRAAYHFYDPDVSGLEQAKAFWRVASTQPGELLALDFERFPQTWSHGRVRREVKDFLTYLEDKSGSRPLIYTRADVWDGVMGADAWHRDYTLWVAHYSQTAETPLLPVAWDQWALWQYGIGRWPGVSGKVDRNRVHKDFAEALNG